MYVKDELLVLLAWVLLEKKPPWFLVIKDNYFGDKKLHLLWRIGDEIDSFKMEIHLSIIAIRNDLVFFQDVAIDESELILIPVSYTHLTLPTIYSV